MTPDEMLAALGDGWTAARNGDGWAYANAADTILIDWTPAGLEVGRFATGERDGTTWPCDSPDAVVAVVTLLTAVERIAAGAECGDASPSCAEPTEMEGYPWVVIDTTAFVEPVNDVGHFWLGPVAARKVALDVLRAANESEERA